MLHIETPMTPSWQLRVNVNEFEVIEQSLIVTGETHIGGVIVQLIDKLNNIRNDWSDFALWWPDKNCWLNKNKMTLDQYGVQADAILHFTRIHKYIRLNLPDQQIIDLNVDFSQNIFYVMKQICKELSIRHFEELSLLKSLNNIDITKDKRAKKNNENLSKMINNKETGSISSGTSTLNNSSSNNSSSLKSKSRDQREKSVSLSGNDSFGHSDFDMISLSYSPIVCTQDFLAKNTIKYKSVFDKTKMNSRWLDSSKSLMEQNVKENDLIQLKFKYYAFFDLNSKHDIVRINQIYEQAKWAILTEEIDCTEQELINFAALQLQVQLQTRSFNTKTMPDFSRIPSHDGILSKANYTRNNSLLIEDVHKSLKNRNDLVDEEDDIETALNKLEQSLDIVDNSKPKNDLVNNSQSQSNNQLEETLLLMKQQKYTFKKFRQFYFILDDNHYLSYFKSKQESNGKPLDKINLKSCEVVPDVNLSHRKFGIYLRVPSSEGMNELCIRCETEQSYANWMSALKLASKGKPLSDMSYSVEIKSILNLLNMQQTKSLKGSQSNLNTLNSATFGASFQSISNSEPDPNEVQATNLLPIRMLKKFKLKQLNDRILEAYSTISDLDINDSKWRYIKEWQGLPNYGISYFAVKMRGSRFKEEIIGVTSNRLLRISPEGETLKAWRFSSMKSWNVNWDIKQFEIIFDDGELVFMCLSCDAKILHEFIGGYIYLSLRQAPKSDGSSNGLTNEDMFFKLTDKR